MRDFDNDSAVIVKNIRELLDRRTGKTQKALAEYCGITTSAVTQWMKGATNISPENLRHTADFFGVPISRLMEVDVKSFTDGEEPPEGVVSIPEYKLSFSAGAGRVPEWDFVEGAEPAWYRRTFFTKRHINPNKCRRAKVCGDSMDPEIQNGDTILFTVSGDSLPGTHQIKDGSVYAIAIDGEFRVKRLFRIKNGLMIVSDNPLFSPERYVGDECDRISIFGKVIQIERALT